MHRFSNPELIVGNMNKKECGYVTVLDFAEWDKAKKKLQVDESEAADIYHLVASEDPLHVQMYLTGESCHETTTWNAVFKTFVAKKRSVMALPFQHAADLSEDELLTAAEQLLQNIVGWSRLEEMNALGEMKVHVYVRTNMDANAWNRAIRRATALPEPHD